MAPIKPKDLMHLSRTTPREMAKVIDNMREGIANNASKAELQAFCDQMVLINNQWPGSAARTRYENLSAAIGCSRTNISTIPWQYMQAETTFKRASENLDECIAITWFAVKRETATEGRLKYVRPAMHQIMMDVWGLHHKDAALPTHHAGFSFIRQVMINCMFYAAIPRGDISKIIGKDRSNVRHIICYGTKFLEGIRHEQSIDTCRFAPNDKSIRRVSAWVPLRDIEAAEGRRMASPDRSRRSDRTQGSPSSYAGEPGGGSPC